jgi:hypothetical protein
MPCWFDVGRDQLTLWQSFFGLALQQAEHNFVLAEQRLPKYLLPRTRMRLEQADHANRQIMRDVKNLFDSVGLEAKIAPEFANDDASRLLQYMELLLRDWAWDTAIAPPLSENTLELERLRAALIDVAKPLGHTLVLGSGAGRLSWDIQCHFNPETTLAVDVNPLLCSGAHRLVALQQPWQLTELQADPQVGLPPLRHWPLMPPGGNNDNRSRWFAVAANGWAPPLKRGALDTLITPWFIDVNGGDIRALIVHARALLKPGGLWINTGPLLYGGDASPLQRYAAEEIIEFLELAGFHIEYQKLAVTPFLNSPLSMQMRAEQVWTFVARAPGESARLPDSDPPNWVVLPHLPIPKLVVTQPQDPVLRQILDLVDGRVSISDIAALFAPNLEPGQDPINLVQVLFMEHLLPPK